MNFLGVYKWWMLIPLICSIAGYFPLTGMPGNALIYLLDHFIMPLFVSSAAPVDAGYGDATETIAIAYSVFLPWLLFALFAGFHHVFYRLPKHAIWAMVVASALCLVTVLHLTFCYPIALMRADENISFQMQQNLPGNTRANLLRLNEPLAASLEEPSVFMRQIEQPGYMTDYVSRYKMLADKIIRDPMFYGVTPLFAQKLAEMEGIMTVFANTPGPFNAQMLQHSPSWQKLVQDARAISKMSKDLKN